MYQPTGSDVPATNNKQQTHDPNAYAGGHSTGQGQPAGLTATQTFQPILFSLTPTLPQQPLQQQQQQQQQWHPSPPTCTGVPQYQIVQPTQEQAFLKPAQPYSVSASSLLGGSSQNTTGLGPLLSKYDEKRKRITFELLDTEKTYKDFLVRLHEACIEPIKSFKVLAEKDTKAVFGNIEAIKDLHEIIFQELQTRLYSWNPSTLVADIILKYFKSFHIYSDFINNFDASAAHLAKLLKINPGLAGIEERMMNTGNELRKLSISSYLIMPVQRIPRYVLLLEDLLKHTETSHPDYANIQLASSKVKEISLQINSKKGQTELFHRAFELDKMLTLPNNKKLLKPTRRLIAEHEMTILGGRGSQRVTAFIFNDEIVFTKRKEKTSKGFVFVGVVKLKHMRAYQVGVPDVLTRLKKDGSAMTKSDLGGLSHWIHIQTTNDEEYLCALSSEKAVSACISVIEKLKAENQMSCWKKVNAPNYPSPRFTHAYAQIGSKFYIHGGQSTGTSPWLDDIWVFNAETKLWDRPKLDKHVSLVEHAATSVGSSVYIFGGHKQGEYSTRLYEIAAHLPTLTFAERALNGQPPPPRSRHSLVAIGSRLYCFGGSYRGASRRGSTSNDYNDVWEYDLSTFRWTLMEPKNGVKPVPRYGHTAVVYKSKMYIFGGRNNQQDLADLWNFDPQTQIWTQIMDAVGFMPTGRQAAAACVHGSNMVLLGGESATTVFSDVFLYNFESNAWSLVRLPVPSDPRMGSNIALMKDFSLSNTGVIQNVNLFVFGGRVQKDDGAKIPSNDVSICQLEDKWIQNPAKLDEVSLTTPWDLWRNAKRPSYNRLNVKLIGFNIHHGMGLSTYLANLGREKISVNWDGRAESIQFLERVGIGSYGEVWRASIRDSVVAVRVVHLQNGADPYKFYGAVHAEATTVWVVMEYLHAKSVRELIRMQKQFNERQVATICAYSLLGMAYLHSNNVVLKSIKSSNILITETGDIKLADYGLNPWMNEVAMKTAPFDEVLEAAYNAPELNMNAVTSKADVFALGIAVIEMLENTPPYKVIQKPKKISPDLVDFATQCTNVNMIKRPESNSLILHPFIGMARAGALNNFYTRETNLNISFLHLRSKSVAPQLVSGGSNSNPRGLSSSPSSETVCSRPTSISMLPSPSTSSPLSPAGGLSLQSYPTITQVPNPVGSSQGAQTPPQQQPAAGSNNDLIAIKGVFRRYREDIFQEKIPLDAAELMEKRLEELEADIMAILNRTPTQSDSPAAGVRRLPPNVNASSQ